MMRPTLAALAAMLATVSAHATQTDASERFFTRAAPGAGRLALDADTTALRAAARDATRILVEDFPLPGRAPVDLELEPFPVLAPDARILLATDHGSVPADVDPSRYLFLRGRVAGRPASHAFLALGDAAPAGRIELGPGDPTYAIAPSPDADLAVFEARAAGSPAPLCGIDDPAPDPAARSAPTLPRTPAAGPDPVKGMRQGELAVDADYEFFSLFDSEQDAIDYAVQVYANVSDHTARDTRTRLDLIFLRVWTTPDDPYGDVATFPIIDPKIGYDVAQLISGRKDASAGGVAYLCGTRSWIAYALGFFTEPTAPSIYNQDIRIAAHELGHNLGAPHTQDLGLDTCYGPSGPPLRGTIMSYCSQIHSGGSALTDLRYHTACQQTIADCLADRPNFVFDCNQNMIDDAVDIAEGTSADANANGIPDECEDCNENGVLDTQDIASGNSQDLNANGIPDECEPDCNANGVPDDLDIAMGTSTDAYGNGVPDECETDCNANGVSDYTEIQLDMTLDVDRNAVLDACQDCDQDGISDIEALDGANNAWAIAATDGIIREYHALTGVPMRTSEPGHLTDARDLLITPDARILVTSAADDRVAEFDRTGAYVADLVPAGAGGLDEPGGMLLHDGALLVASSASDNVLRYDPDTGAFLGVFAAADDGGLDGPYALAVGPNDNILVSSDDDRVLEFDADTGAFVRAFIDHDDNGGLLFPRAIVPIPGGPVVVASQLTDQLLAYDPDTGAFLAQYHNGDYNGHLDEPWGLRLGPDGDLYAAASASGESGGGHALHLTDPRILRYDADNGNLLFSYVQALDSHLNGPRGFDFMPSDGDCNRNLIPDSCDIADGTSADTNDNGIPDECEGICYPDFNDDGALNVLDFVAFQLSWQSADPDADCDDNQAFDILDFTCFQQHFQSGCP